MSATGAEYIQSRAKRSLDVSGSLLLAAAASPAVAATALETCIEHRTLNPIFIQKRLGKEEKEFSTYKFQSIRAHVPQLVMGGVNHPHASPIGRLIRSAGLDETPQLFNVLRGDISLVGIRPMPLQTMVAFRETVDDETLFEEWRECYAQNPGLTGEGQLFTHGFSDHNSADVIRRRMEIDIESFHDASLENDIRTLGRTPLTLIQTTARRSYHAARLALSFSAQADTI